MSNAEAKDKILELLYTSYREVKGLKKLSGLEDKLFLKICNSLEDQGLIYTSTNGSHDFGFHTFYNISPNGKKFFNAIEENGFVVQERKANEETLKAEKEKTDKKLKEKKDSIFKSIPIIVSTLALLATVANIYLQNFSKKAEVNKQTIDSLRIRLNQIDSIQRGKIQNEGEIKKSN